MAAHSKRRKVIPRKKRQRRRTANGHHHPKALKLARSRIPLKKPVLAHDDEEPKPEELAREEVIKPEALEAATAIPEAEASAATRGRERNAYDGDTAIKLYLREIGQVKLLTPQAGARPSWRAMSATRKRANK